MKQPILMTALLVLTSLSCAAAGKPWSKRHLMEYFAQEQIAELVLAANKGDVKKIDDLVAQGIDVNYKGRKDVTPLFAQMASLNIQGFKRLLEHGADPNIPIIHGESVIWLAATASSNTNITIDMLRLCLEHGGNPNIVFHEKDKKNREPYSSAFEEGVTLISGAIAFSDRPLEVVKLLYEYGANINARDESGVTALMRAVPEHYDVAFFLLLAGADYSAKANYEKDFLWNIEQFPVYNPKGKDEEQRQREYRQKVIQFLKEKGIEVHLKYP